MSEGNEGGVRVDAEVRPEVFCAGIISLFAAMQLERTMQTSKFVELMQQYATPRKITRMERVKWWMDRRRVALAKWIAGDDWPDEA